MLCLGLGGVQHILIFQRCLFFLSGSQKKERRRGLRGMLRVGAFSKQGGGFDFADLLEACDCIERADIDVVKLGQSVAENIDPKELEAFSQNVMSNLGSVQNLCSSVMGAGGIGGSQPGQSQQTQNPMMDLGGLSSVMGMLGKMM